MAAPTITSIAPNSGVYLGGTVVQVSGTGFMTGVVGVPIINIEGIMQASIVVNSDTSMSFTTVASPVSTIADGTQHTTVTTNNGTSATSGADLFLFTAPPPSTAYYQDNNIFMDSFASYDMYGRWSFTSRAQLLGGANINGMNIFGNIFFESMPVMPVPTVAAAPTHTLPATYFTVVWNNVAGQFYYADLN